MVINFFEPNCQTITKAVEFGLCDDPPPPYNVPAYIDAGNPSKWIAVVKNKNQTSVTFTAIDGCIMIKRPNGEDSKRCDAMLTYENKIIFVELKESIRDNSFDGGIGQLIETIDFFKQNHPLNQYQQKTAYIANSLKPNFQFGNKTTIDKFKKRTGFILRTKNEILVS
jgi:hypothetical protein